MNAADYCAVYITAGGEEEAERIASLLVEKRLAACVTRVGPIQSVYRWKGAVESAAEVLLIAKTKVSTFEALRVAVRAAHSYEVPEIVALPLSDGDADYLRWIEENAAGENE
ncbi:MAG: divalent-cation tolerance protein CutA [bacterium]